MSSVIRISSPAFDDHNKRVVLNEKIEAWIDEDTEAGGRWVDISTAVRAVQPILEYGGVARADVRFFIAGVALGSLVLTDESVEDLRAFLVQIDAQRAADAELAEEASPS